MSQSRSNNKNMNPTSMKNVAMNNAREYYELLQKKELAKKQQTPSSSSNKPPSSTSSTKVPPEPEKKKKKASRTGCSPGKVASSNSVDEAKAKAHARQYYNKLVNKEQKKKDRLMQVPALNKHVPTASMNHSGQTKNQPKPSAPTPLRTSSKSSRIYEKLYNDLRHLEEYEEQQQQSTNSATPQPYVLLSPKKSSSTTPHSIPLVNKTFSSTNCFQRRSIVPPKIIATTKTATATSNQTILESFTTWNLNSDLLKVLFQRPLSVIDMVIFLAIFVMETKFSILSNIIPILFRYTFYCALNTVVLTMNYGVLNTLIALLISIGTLFVLRQYTNPSSLLQLIRMNQNVKDTQIQTDVQTVLRLVYNELMMQPQVNIPLNTLQQMIFTKLFQDTLFEKKKKYWMDIIWPRVVGQMLYRHDPNIVVMSSNNTGNNTFGSDDTYIRWIASSTTSTSFDANNATNEILKKRKTSNI
jgi:hypothetical protein